MKFPSLVAALLVAAASFAQDDARRFLPTPLLAEFQCDGLSVLAKKFEDTSIGVMCATQDWQVVWGRIVDLAESAAEDGEIPLDGVVGRCREVLADYAGRIHAGVSLTLSGPDPHVELVVVLTPDGTTDFEEIQRLIAETVVEEAGARIESGETPNGSVDLVVIDEDAVIRAMLPAIVDGHLVFALGTLDDYLLDLGQAEGPADEPSPDPVSLRIAADAWATIAEIPSKSSDPDMAIMFDVMMSPFMFMFGGARALSVAVRPTDRYAELVFDLDYDAEASSLLTSLEVDARASDLMAFAPRDLAAGSTFSVDLGAAIEAFEAMAAGRAGPRFAEVEGMVESATGLRLREDVLAHLDGTILYVSDFGEAAEEASVSVTLGLNDAAALEKSVESAIRKRGLHAGRKTKDYRGRSVRSLNLGFFMLEWAFTEKHLVTGFGYDGGGVVRRILDGVADRKNGDAPLAWSKTIESRMACLPQDHDWLFVQDMGGDVELEVEFVELSLRGDDVPAEIADIMVEVVRILAEHDLMSTVGSVGLGSGRLTCRQIW